MLSRALLALALTPLAVVGRHFIIQNQCPSQINLYINGEYQGPLSRGGQTERDFDSHFSGFIYTDANGGNQNGLGTTRAGFYGEYEYYYVVVDPNHFNTGVTISTGQLSYEGYCSDAYCGTLTCPNVFHQPPTFFPPPVSHAPALPLHGCGTSQFKVTFCPDGRFPSPDDLAVTLHPNGNQGKCLDVRGGVFANGTPVQIYDCLDTPAQKWVINKGRTKLRVAGTNFCLDAGSAPANGVKGKIWQCYDNLPSQDWWYTDDNRIALTGQGFCLDLTDGIVANSNQVQTWQCIGGNANQIWTE
jgi:hypothetical protein